MGREFERTQRVSHFLHEELARLLQSTVRDPRVQEVNLTGVEVSRDLSPVSYTHLTLPTTG